MSFREKALVLTTLLLITAILFFWTSRLYLHFTVTEPRVGGEYSEGLIGQPLYVNPLLSLANETDADICKLVFSSLLKYNEKGELVPDLLENWEISEDGKVYTLKLKSGVKWHDNTPLTAKDVVFTINIVQDPAYRSPWRLNWQDVEVEQNDEYQLTFRLKENYFGFLNNLTMGILPKHIWDEVTAERFYLSEYNLRPLGSGSYVFADWRKNPEGKITTYEFKAFPDYYEGAPYISRLRLNFYEDEDSLIEAYNKKEINGISSLSPSKLELITRKDKTFVYELIMPKYFALFINKTKSLPLANVKVREALAWGVNREQIIREVLNGKGLPVFSPFMSQMKNYEPDIARYEYNPEKAKNLLEEAGWKIQEDGIRGKDQKKLEITILSLDWPILTQTAELLRLQWEELGVLVKVNAVSLSDLQQNYIRPREYETLLFGQNLGFNPDPYYFWSSERKRDPGLNLSLFENKRADEVLEKARVEKDEQKRKEYYSELQKIITREIPAVFLYSQNYLYPVSRKVKGITAENISTHAERWVNINKWYIKTKRVWRDKAGN